MRLRQGQVWKLSETFIRIVLLERLVVEYKSMRDLTAKEGTRHRVTKKEFCRLLKTAVLLSPVEITEIQDAQNPWPHSTTEQ